MDHRPLVTVLTQLESFLSSEDDDVDGPPSQ